MNYSFVFGKTVAQMSNKEYLVHRSMLVSTGLKYSLKDFVKEHKLDTRSRKRELIYLRCLLYRFLKDQGLILSQIGGYFNRDHATVLNGLRVYDSLVCTNDKEFFRAKQKWGFYFDNLKID